MTARVWAISWEGIGDSGEKVRKKLEKQEKPYASMPKRWGSGLLDFRFWGQGRDSVFLKSGGEGILARLPWGWVMGPDRHSAK